MTFEEVGVVFACGSEHLAGVLARPAQSCDLGVVIVVGGPQYRAGSHRQFVLLARFLAAAGYPVLRFDARGMGDSSGEAPGFEHLDEDIGAAIDTLVGALPTLRGVVLWGLCDGASAGLLYLQRRADPRVIGLCLLNPWARTPAGLARTHLKHYYVRRLLEPSFWAKLARGGLGRRALRELAGSLGRARGCTGSPPFPIQMAEACERFPGPVLLLLSGNDFTAREFVELAAGTPTWQRALARPGVQRRNLPGADHTFSNATDRVEVERLTLEWLQAMPDEPGSSRKSISSRMETEST